MTLKDLLFANVVKDTDRIEISKPLTGWAIDLRKGNWFEDRILEFMNLEIRAFSYDEKRGFSIALKGDEDV